MQAFGDGRAKEFEQQGGQDRRRRERRALLLRAREVRRGGRSRTRSTSTSSSRRTSNFDPPKHKAIKEKAQKRFDDWFKSKTKAGAEAPRGVPRRSSTIKDAANSIAAAARIGQISAALLGSAVHRRDPEQTSAPARYAEDAVDAYCDALTTEAEPLSAKSLEAFSACLVEVDRARLVQRLVEAVRARARPDQAGRVPDRLRAPRRSRRGRPDHRRRAPAPSSNECDRNHCHVINSTPWATRSRLSALALRHRRLRRRARRPAWRQGVRSPRRRRRSAAAQGPGRAEARDLEGRQGRTTRPRVAVLRPEREGRLERVGLPVGRRQVRRRWCASTPSWSRPSSWSGCSLPRAATCTRTPSRRTRRPRT